MTQQRILIWYRSDLRLHDHDPLHRAADRSVTAIYFSKEVTAEEVAVEIALQSAVKSSGIRVEGFWRHTLYHPDDPPFSIHQVPEVFTSFRKEVEKSTNDNSGTSLLVHTQGYV